MLNKTVFRGFSRLFNSFTRSNFSRTFTFLCARNFDNLVFLSRCARSVLSKSTTYRNKENYLSGASFANPGAGLRTVWLIPLLRKQNSASGRDSSSGQACFCEPKRKIFSFPEFLDSFFNSFLLFQMTSSIKLLRHALSAAARDRRKR